MRRTARGIDVKTPLGESPMPGFNDRLSSTQIAALATYVRGNFVNIHGAEVAKEQVEIVLSNKMHASWLIRNAATLAIIGIVVALFVCLFLRGFALNAIVIVAAVRTKYAFVWVSGHDSDASDRLPLPCSLVDKGYAFRPVVLEAWVFRSIVTGHSGIVTDGSISS